MRAGVARPPRLGDDVGTRGGGGRELLSGEALAGETLRARSQSLDLTPTSLARTPSIRELTWNWSQGSHNSRDFL